VRNIKFPASKFNEKNVFMQFQKNKKFSDVSCTHRRTCVYGRYAPVKIVIPEFLLIGFWKSHLEPRLLNTSIQSPLFMATLLQMSLLSHAWFHGKIMNSAYYFLFLLSQEGSVDRTCHIVLLAEFESILTLD